jgi:hypothetical protein
MRHSTSRHRCATFVCVLAAELVLAAGAAAQDHHGDASMPGEDGGMVIGGPLEGTILPGADGGQVLGGPLSGSGLPGRDGGMVIGGPGDGSNMPVRDGSDYGDRGRFEEVAPEEEGDDSGDDSDGGYGE